MYLNIDLPDDIRIFQPDEFDNARPAGRRGDPSGLKDDDNNTLPSTCTPAWTPRTPATRRRSVAVTYDPFRMFVVDYENRRGGGLQAAHEQFKEWLARYDCRHWDIEEVGWQKAIRQSETIRDWARRNDVVLQGHETTAQNKWDPIYGVGAMSELFHNGQIDVAVGQPGDGGEDGRVPPAVGVLLVGRCRQVAPFPKPATSPIF